jgi:hypothetical protein
VIYARAHPPDVNKFNGLGFLYAEAHAIYGLAHSQMVSNVCRIRYLRLDSPLLLAGHDWFLKRQTLVMTLNETLKRAVTYGLQRKGLA